MHQKKNIIVCYAIAQNSKSMLLNLWCQATCRDLYWAYWAYWAYWHRSTSSTGWACSWAYKLDLIVLARAWSIVMIPAHSSALHITSHGLSNISVILSGTSLSAFNTSWIGTYLRRTEVMNCFTVTFARWVISVKPLCCTIPSTANASGVSNGASRTEKTNSVVLTVSVTLITVFANKAYTRLASDCLSYNYYVLKIV